MRNLRISSSTVFSILLCALLAAISCRVYIPAGLPNTHDSENHLARFANFKLALKEGQMPPRFAPNLYHRYGYPVFNYNYPLANILSVPFSLVKIPYQNTFKVLVVTSVILLLYGIWKWLSMLHFSIYARLAAVVSVAVSPYLLQTLIYRGSIGEVMAVSLMTWWLVWTEWVRRNKNLTPFAAETIIGGILLALFFLSHNVTVLFGTPLLLLFSIWRLWKSKVSRLKTATAFCIGLGLTMWFWIPALAEQSASIVGGSSLAQQYLQHFPTLHELLSSSFQFGFSFVGSVDSLSFALGLMQWAGLFCFAGWVFAAVFKPKSTQRLDQAGVVFFVLSLLFLVFQLAVTTPLWQIIPLARYIQFPWRLGLFAMITNAVVISWIVQKNIPWQKRLITFVAIIQMIIALRIMPTGYYDKPILEYDLFEQSTTTSNENLPKNFVFQSFADWKPTAVVLNGKASLSISKWTGSKRSYTVTAESPVVVAEPTMYYPGWETTVTSGNSYRLAEYVDNEVVGGRIAYALEPGTYQIQSEFTQHTVPRIVGNSITILSAAFVLGASAWLLFAFFKSTTSSNAKTR